MLETISNAVEAFGKLFPRIRNIKRNERGVKFLPGDRVKMMSPGLTIFWPIITTLETVIVTRQVLDLPIQTLITKDMKSIIISGTIVYTINDVYKYLIDNYDAIDSINEMCRAAIKDVVTSYTLEEIQINQDSTIYDILTNTARDSLSSFGIDVEYAKLTDFSWCFVLNIVSPTSEQKTIYSYT